MDGQGGNPGRPHWPVRERRSGDATTPWAHQPSSATPNGVEVRNFSATSSLRLGRSGIFAINADPIVAKAAIHPAPGQNPRTPDNRLCSHSDVGRGDVITHDRYRTPCSVLIDEPEGIYFFPGNILSAFFKTVFSWRSLINSFSNCLIFFCASMSLLIERASWSLS